MNEAMQKLIDMVQKASPVIWQAAYRQVYVDLAEMILCVIGLLFVARALMLWRKEYIASESDDFTSAKWDLQAIGMGLSATACYLVSVILTLYIHYRLCVQSDVCGDQRTEGAIMTERELMQKIHSEWGTLITDACKPVPPTSDGIVPYVMPMAHGVQPAFLAALIANESGGEPNAKRFEKKVLADIFQVLLGRETYYAGIDRSSFMDYIDAGAVGGQGSGWLKLYLTNTLNKLDGLATSWGLTQIMGWHILQPSWANAPGWYRSVDDLRVPKSNLLCARVMLEEFAVRFNLDLSKHSVAMFRCWNTGSLTGETFDADYIAKGLSRINLYEQIVAESAASAQKPDKTQ